MSFAFGHLIFAWLLGKGYEKLSHKQLSRWGWFFLLFASILPDADFLLDWTLGTEIHRTLTHSLLFVLAMGALGYGIGRWRFAHTREGTEWGLAAAGGVTTHLLLDMAGSGYGTPLFWPSLLHFSFTKIAYFDPMIPSFLHSSSERILHSLKLAILDMGMGTAWLFYLWWKKRVEF
ncbi:metal-dependent hydrolase [Candidatus Woesearchaeota archaeon]|nr:metal-dependent hydrolase [Candidatus Woesearchaeota archaeon]